MRLTSLSEEGIRRGQGDRHSSEDHHGVRGLQASQLHHQEEPAQRPGPHRAEEVLPELRQAHVPPRDALTGRRGVATDPSYIGRRYTLPEPYLVGREKIREFADAIGADDPAYRDPA